MVVEESVSGEHQPQLPQLSLQSMSQCQLEEFIPKLVTQVTGRVSPLFGSSQYKPDWWPHNVEWNSPEKIIQKFEDPSETLREIVRSCYCHSENESLLLTEADLPSYTKSHPVSPIVADREMCAAEPTSSDTSHDNMDTEETMCTSELPSNTAAEDQFAEKTASAIKQEPGQNDDYMIIDDESENNCPAKQNSTNRDAVNKTNTETQNKCDKLDLSLVKHEDESSEASDINEDDTVDGKDANSSEPVVEKFKLTKEDSNGSIEELEVVEVFDDSIDLEDEETGSNVELDDKDTKPVKKEEISIKIFDEHEEGVKKSPIKINKSVTSRKGGKVSIEIIEDVSTDHTDDGGQNNIKDCASHKDSSADSKPSSITVDAEIISEIDKEILKSLQTMGVWNTNMSKKKPAKLKADAKISKTKQNDDVKYLGPKFDTEIKAAKIQKKSDVSDQKKTSDDQAKTASSKSSSHKEEKQEDDVVWICFICAKGFSNQDELMSHQDTCEDVSESDVTPLKSCDPTPCDTSSSTSAMPGKTTSGIHPLSDLAIGMCSSKQKQSALGFQTKPDKTSVPVPTLLTKVGSGIKTLPLGLPTQSRMIRRRRKVYKDVYIPPPRETYFECLGLGETPKVAEFAKSPRKSVSEEDCQIIDLTLEDSQSPQSVPMTPRTRLMMSQLSREDSNGRRRHLSFSSQSASVIANEKEKTPKKEKKSNNSDSSSESSEDEKPQRKNVPSKSVLLGIPLTSPLGQRLKKHWQNESKCHVISNVEQYCSTSNIQEHYVQKKPDKKNPMMEKLRNRPPPQVTFRFTKKYINKWFHLYKFTKADKREFLKRIKTGLERESRIKKKRMKPCKVVLRRLSKKDIKYWTTPRPKQITRMSQNMIQTRPNRNFRMALNQQMYQRQIVQAQNRPMMFLNPSPGNQYNIRGLIPGTFIQQSGVTGLQSVRQGPQPGLLINNGPTPQLLVRTVVGGGQNMRLEVTPMSQSPSQTQVMTGSFMPPNILRSQKRKQVFSNIRADDNMVICLSSDEEEEITTPQSSCNTCRKSKETCTVHGGQKKKIGPASFMKSQKTVNVICQLQKSTVSQLPAYVMENNPKTPTTPPISDSASLRVFGKSFQAAGSAPQQPAATSEGKTYTNVRMTNGMIVSSVKEEEVGVASVGVASVGVASVPSSQTFEPQILETVSLATVSQPDSPSVRSQSDSDYMDFEVICIDSDED